MDEAVAALARGGVVVLPTDTVYGLATRADSEPGIDRIYELKGRPDNKPFQVLVDGPAALERFAEPSPAASKLAAAFWPGPLTIVTVAKAGAPQGVVREGRIGLRSPDHPLALELVAASGPLAATSANRTGQPTPATVDDLKAIFGTRVDAYVDGGVIETLASTVVNISNTSIEVIREGPITREALESAIGA